MNSKDPNDFDGQILQEHLDRQKGIQPAAGLEDRVVSALKREGAIQRSRSLRWPTAKALLTIASCLLLFVSGLWIGSQQKAQAGSVMLSDSTFVLFLVQGPAYRPAVAGIHQNERIAEYRNWAISIRKGGTTVVGMKLRPQSQTMGGDARTNVAGYFLIDAKNFAEAERIARSCPHLRYGGEIEIRQIHPV